MCVRLLTLAALLLVAITALGGAPSARADGCVPSPKFGVTCPPQPSGATVGYPNGQPAYAAGWTGYIFSDPLGVLASPTEGPATGFAGFTTWGGDLAREFCLYLRSEGISCGVGGW